MKHRSPAKLLRSIKRMTRFLERKAIQSSSPISEQSHPPAAVSPDTPFPTITLKDFEKLLKIQNEKLLEQRKQERIEDMKKLNILLGLPP